MLVENGPGFDAHGGSAAVGQNRRLSGNCKCGYRKMATGGSKAAPGPGPVRVGGLSFTLVLWTLLKHVKGVPYRTKTT